MAADHRTLVLLVRDEGRPDQISVQSLVDGRLSSPSLFDPSTTAVIYAWSSPDDTATLGLVEGAHAALGPYDPGAHLPRGGTSYQGGPDMETRVLVAPPTPLKTLRLPTTRRCPRLASAPAVRWPGAALLAATAQPAGPGMAPDRLVVIDAEGGAYGVAGDGVVTSLRVEAQDALRMVSAASGHSDGVVLAADVEGQLLRARDTVGQPGLELDVEGFLIAHHPVYAVAAEPHPHRGIWALTFEFTRNAGRVQGFVERFEKGEGGQEGPPQRALLSAEGAGEGPVALLNIGDNHVVGAWPDRADRMFELIGADLEETAVPGLSALAARGQTLIAGTRSGEVLLAPSRPRVFRTLQTSTSPVQALQTLPHGFVAVFGDGRLELFDAEGRPCGAAPGRSTLTLEQAQGLGDRLVLIGTEAGQRFVQVWSDPGI